MSVTWPAHRDELEKHGYRFPTTMGSCRGCGAAICWVETPHGKKMPLNRTGVHLWESHFASCPEAEAFRKKKKKRQEDHGKESSKEKSTGGPEAGPHAGDTRRLF